MIDFAHVYVPKLNEIPFLKKNVQKHQELIQLWSNEKKYYSTEYRNILPSGTNWSYGDTSSRLDFFLRRKIQNLCKGAVSFRNINTFYTFSQYYICIVQCITQKRITLIQYPSFLDNACDIETCK